MTERTMLKRTRAAPLDEDALSITSSQNEEYSSDEEFLVERILAEKRGADNEILYLIYWAGYPKEKSTWEPKDNIQDPDILETWKARKDLEARGDEPAFDVVGFSARIAQIERARAQRHRLRKVKRRRLGIPVSPSASSEYDEVVSTDDSDSIEALEVNELPDDDPGMRTKTKPRLRNRNAVSNRQDTRLQSSGIESAPRRFGSRRSVEDSSDSSDIDKDIFVGDKKKERQNALRSIQQKRSHSLNTSKEPIEAGRPDAELTLPVLNAEPKTSGSSSDAQLIDRQQKRQGTKSSSEKLLAHRVSTQSRGEPKSSSTVASRPLLEKASLGELPASTLRPQSTRRILSSERGRGATRGGHLARRNVFERREPPKKRPTLIEAYSDPNKDQRLFNNWHMRRKVELAGRHVADAAPDLAALGGLFDPSNPSSFQSLRPASLRKLSSNTIPQQSDAPQQPIEMEEPSEATDSRKDPTNEMVQQTAIQSSHHDESSIPNTYNRPSYLYERHGFNAVCYFWYFRGSCSRGPDCSFIHSNDVYLPVAPAPNKTAKDITERGANQAPQSEAFTLSDTQAGLPERQKRDIHNEICFFWHRSGTCQKGADCSFVHDISVDLPVAPNPNLHSRDVFSQDLGGYDRQLEAERMQYRNEDQEARDGRREPRSEQRVVQPYNSLLSDTSNTPYSENIANRAAGEGAATRPQWDARDPHNSICYFWHTTGNCVRRPDCKYLHTSRSDLPLAPKPVERPSKPCKFWAIGDCYAGDRCKYMHSSDLPAESSDSVQIPELSAPASAPAKPRKSVSFAIDDQELEADNLVPTHAKRGPPPEEAERYNRPCIFWARNDCYRGEKCWYQHPDEGDGPRERIPGTRPPAEYAENADTDLNHAQSPESSGSITFLPPQSPPGSMGPLLNTSPPNSEISSYASEIVPTSSTTKIDMEEYRRKRASRLLGSGEKEVIFGNDELQSIVLDFGDISEGLQQSWGHSFATLRTLHFRQMCAAQDYEALYSLLQPVIFFHGTLEANPIDKVALDKASQHLRLHSGGLISVLADFTVLIYPVMEEWKFLWQTTNMPPEGRLRYIILRPGVDLRKALAPKAPTPDLYRKTLAKSVHGLRYRRFFHPSKADQVYHFYLMFPSGANQTAAFFASWLRASDSRCKVYSSQTEGSWNFFVKNPDILHGVVLVHESVVAYISELPSLYRLIVPSVATKMYTFWSIHDSSAIYPIFRCSETSSLGQITVTRILPHGHAIFFTPSLLIAEPDRAYYLIKWFQEKLKISTPGTYKLVCAYDIRSYLLQLALEKSSERDLFYERYRDNPAKDAMAAERGLSYQTCEVRFKCHSLISDMILKSMQSEFCDPCDLDQTDDEINTIVYADRSIDPDDEQSLVKWFAGWSIKQLDRFRKYTVVGTNSSSSKRAVRIKENTILGTPKAAGSSVAGGSALKDQMDIDDQSLDMIASINVEQLPQLPPSSTADIGHATVVNTSLHVNTAAGTRSPASRVITGDHSPHHGLSPFSPSHLDGAKDGRVQSPQSAKSNNSARSPNVTDVDEHNGQMNTISKEIAMKETGSALSPVLSEDRDVNRNRRIIDGILRSESSSGHTSRRGSTTSSGVQSPSVGEKMDSDGPQESGAISANTITMDGAHGSITLTGDGGETTWRELRYEHTTAWYRRLREEGKGWEHIYVEGWEKCYKNLGVK